jgi:hypothetical protein
MLATVEAADALRAAIDLVREPSEQVEIALALGTVMVQTGRAAEALPADTR